MHIAIAGNIGSGKTTLTQLLAKHYNWIPQYEDVDDNPYLTSFYEDMQRWSFNLQVFFLNTRFRHVIDIRKQAKAYIKKTRGHLEHPEVCGANLVRLQMMEDFGYYVTESSEHNAEYAPFWIKKNYPELVTEFGIPLDEYPRRCVNQIEGWKKEYASLKKTKLTHKLSREYGSAIMEAVLPDKPIQIGGNVLNKGFITNLPSDAVVEVPCLVNAQGVNGSYVGPLPPQCAAMNMTNINCQLLTIEAAVTMKKEHIYQAAMMDPHTGSELDIDTIKKMVDDLIDAHGDYLPKYH